MNWSAEPMAGGRKGTSWGSGDKEATYGLGGPERVPRPRQPLEVVTGFLGSPAGGAPLRAGVGAGSHKVTYVLRPTWVGFF